jgi:hypothetical protein
MRGHDGPLLVNDDPAQAEQAAACIDASAGCFVPITQLADVNTDAIQVNILPWDERPMQRLVIRAVNTPCPAPVAGFRGVGDVQRAHRSPVLWPNSLIHAAAVAICPFHP